MHRRGHLSKKVPNVKLRPTEKPVASSSKLSQPVEQSVIDEEELEVDVDSNDKPLRDMVICATGIEHKGSLFKRAIELGASRSDSFTDQTTHLIAQAAGSAKYLCAVERGVSVLLPSFVSDCHARWKAGENIDVEDVIGQHAFPIFDGVNLCVSGNLLTEERVNIHRLVQENGGMYSKELTAKVTHLLFSTDERTKKRTFAERNGIRILWEEWFWDCIEYGGRWDEQNYDVSQARPKRKPLREVISASTECVAEVPPSIPTSTLVESQDDSEEQGSLRHVPDVKVRLMESLFSSRGWKVTPDGKAHGGPQRTSDPTSKELSRSYSMPVRETPKADANTLSSSAFKRTKSFSSSQEKRPFRRIASTSTALASTPVYTEEPISKPFKDRVFRVLGEACSPGLLSAVRQHGGRVTTSDSEPVDFNIVRLVSGTRFWLEEPDEDERNKFRTECWIEACISRSKIAEVTADEPISITFRPLAASMPVFGAETMNIHFSSFDPACSFWLGRLIRLVGATHAAQMSRSVTHLICMDSECQKAQKAREWDIAVVSIDWLVDMARKSSVPSVTNFPIANGACRSPKRAETQPTLQSERCETMMDITNVDRLGKTKSESALGSESFGKAVGALAEAPGHTRSPKLSASSTPTKASKLMTTASPSKLASPTKIKLSPGHAALRDTMQQLLLKRPNDNDASIEPQHQRRTKRSRPAPRGNSNSSIRSSIAHSASSSFSRRSLSPLRPEFDPEEAENMQLGEVKSKIARVTYENPGQKELFDLLQPQAPTVRSASAMENTVSQRTRRKSNRAPGF